MVHLIISSNFHNNSMISELLSLFFTEWSWEIEKSGYLLIFLQLEIGFIESNTEVHTYY